VELELRAVEAEERAGEQSLGEQDRGELEFYLAEMRQVKTRISTNLAQAKALIQNSNNHK
jgi:hypothetical protein